MDLERVHECVNTRIWIRCAREGGEGEIDTGEERGWEVRMAETRGIEGGGRHCRCEGRGGGGIVVVRFQPACRRRERRKKCWAFLSRRERL